MYLGFFIVVLPLIVFREEQNSAKHLNSLHNYSLILSHENGVSRDRGQILRQKWINKGKLCNYMKKEGKN